MLVLFILSLFINDVDEVKQLGNNDNRKSLFFLLGIGIGAAIGYLAKEQLDTRKTLSPEKALQRAKETFQKNGPINGSWIYMKPEKIEKNGLTYTTYRGGISRNIDGENKQYDYYIDVETGAIIDVAESVKN